jgi:hypothetical protein
MDQKVTLVNESTREYLLLRKGNGDSPDKGIHVDLKETHLRIIKTCVDALVREHPLSCYATQHWQYHARHYGSVAGLFLYYTSALFDTHSGTRDLQ